MTMDIQEEQERLIGLYENLTRPMREVVQVASASKPLSRTNLVQLSTKAGVESGNGSPLSYGKVKDELNAAIGSGVLVYENQKSGPIAVAVLLQDYAFRKAFDSGIAKFLVDSDAKKKYRRYWFDEADACRSIRYAFYSNDWPQYSELIRSYSSRPYLLEPFSQEYYDALSPQFQFDFFTRSAKQLVNLGDERRADFSSRAGELLDGMSELPEAVVAAATDVFSAQGNIAALKQLAARVETQPEIEGCAAFVSGNLGAAREYFESADQQQRKRTKKRSINLRGFPMLFYALLLLKENSAKSQKQVKQILKAIGKWRDVWHLIEVPIEQALKYQQSPTSFVPPNFYRFSMSALSALVTCWIWRWYFPNKEKPFELDTMERLVESYQKTNLGWLGAEFMDMSSHVVEDKAKGKQLAAAAKELHSQLGTSSIVDLVEPTPDWEVGLSALENLCASGVKPQEPDAKVSEERMIWEAELGATWISLTPFMQKYGKKGWSKGRKVGLGRLFDEWQSAGFEFLSEQDQKICKSLKQHVDRDYYGYRETSHEWDHSKLLDGLIGHPNIYAPEDRSVPIELSEQRPHLSINESGGELQLVMKPMPDSVEDKLLVTKESAHRYTVVQFSNEHHRIAELVVGLASVPGDQKERVFQVAQSLASMIDIQSDIEGAPSSGEEVAACSTLSVQLTPFQDGIRAELFVQPFGEKGPFCRPGLGAQAMLANIDGKAFSVTRDLDAERTEFDNLLSDCQPLSSRTTSDQQVEWLFAESEEALEFVVELQQLSEAGKVSVLWPRGRTHEVAGSSSSSGLQASLKRDQDWFAASGKLKVNDELTIDLLKLLDLASQSPSRFVRLDDGRFLALSKELRQRVADIAAFGMPMKNKVRFAAARAMVVDGLFDDVKCKVDKHWTQHLSRIEEAGSLSVDVPSTLQADLRDYQQEGFSWLKRLAHWNTGACLADDMGLGKTVQALALLVDRAFDGPQLVVAPASVGFNWEAETHRFAPTLTAKLFRDSDRDQFFEDIQPGDLVITSYGLLQSEIERFESVQWRTVLLDEAQAIKNMATKRSQAVMQLQADFRIILTGTPMENHLGELWNLFRFIVPGLLGSQEDFRRRFATPIERDNCRATRNRLRKLIQPFLLRRTKSEVLTELPSRSESVLEVELSPAEATLYESVRLKAIERIAEAAEESCSQGEQHLQVLAELTRLRLACCHPELVGGTGMGSTKLNLFEQKIAEILEGRHKVLVFSQFVKHLEILRNALEKMNVSYQYLDGSTSVKKRKQAVEAFQAGEGDVFLISLKAGGTGLNLTAADYVIHMDPWWNPAVEDQATDRAHRIGQQRPVNVYRFIAKGTIEEKIVELHNTKRDLADGLLEGSDSSGKLTTAELIQLLQDEHLSEVAS